LLAVLVIALGVWTLLDRPVDESPRIGPAGEVAGVRVTAGDIHPSLPVSEIAEAAVSPAAESGGGSVTIDDDAFEGGFSSPRTYRGRTARWIYGALSPYGTMIASFTIEGEPGAGKLIVKGIDSESGPRTPMEIRLNDVVIYVGANPLQKDHLRGPAAPWSEVTFPIPEGVLQQGTNILAFSNLAQINNQNAAPFVMLDEVVVMY
jgi:hypothetical protein